MSIKNLLVEMTGIEPVTSSRKRLSLSQLSYIPTMSILSGFCRSNFNISLGPRNQVGGPPEFMEPILERMLLTKFCENGRKKDFHLTGFQEYRTESANAFDFTRKKFFKNCPFVSITWIAVPPNVLSSLAYFPSHPVWCFSPKIGKIHFDDPVNVH